MTVAPASKTPEPVRSAWNPMVFDRRLPVPDSPAVVCTGVVLHDVEQVEAEWKSLDVRVAHERQGLLNGAIGPHIGLVLKEFANPQVTFEPVCVDFQHRGVPGESPRVPPAARSEDTLVTLGDLLAADSEAHRTSADP